MTLALWIDPRDADTVTLEGSPETDRITSITDKSPAGNDVVGGTIAVFQANFDGADGATSYTAETGEVATFVATAQLDTAQSKFGGSSLFLDGNSDGLLFPHDDKYRIGANAFTLECWVRFNGAPSVSSDQLFMAHYDTSVSPAQRSWTFGLINRTLRFGYSTNGVDFTSITDAAWVPADATWYHVAVTRDDNNLVRWFVDGSQLHSQTVSATFHAATSPLQIGRYVVNTQWFDGWIDDVRIVVGRALYTDAFTPPTEPHTLGPVLAPTGDFTSPSPDSAEFIEEGTLTKPNASPTLLNMDGPDMTVLVAHRISSQSPEVFDVEGSLVSMTGDASPLDDTGWRMKTVGRNDFIRASVGDEDTNFIDLLPQWKETVLRGSFDGADAATSFTSEDKYARTATFNNGAQLDTAQKKFGASSLFLVKSNSDYVTFPDSDDWKFGAGDFTVECWIRHASVAAASLHYYIGQWEVSGSQRSWAIRWGETEGALSFISSTDGTAVATATSSAWNPTVNVWHHIAATRVNGTLRLFADGVKIYDGANSDTFKDSTGVLNLGCISNGGPINLFDGWLDDVRVIKGRGLYTEAFTPPTLPNSNTFTSGKAISAMRLDSIAGALNGYQNGDYCDAIEYAGTLGFAKDLVIGDYDKGYIHEVIYFDGAMRSDERQRAEGYLAHKWNFADILPAEHPFKQQGPDIVVASDLLVKFDGADGDTTYTSDDDAARTATFNGNATLDDSQRAFGPTSLRLPGTASPQSYVTFPDSADWHFGSGDFTVECWVRHASNSGIHTYLSHYDSSDANASWILRFNAAGPSLDFVHSAAGVADIVTLSSSSWTPTVGQWYHVAAVRSGNTLKLYADGVEIGSFSLTITFFNAAKPLDIGVVRGGAGLANFFDGWMDQVRVIKGTALYENDFAPPHRGFRLPVTASLIANFNGADAEAGGSPEYLVDSGQVATFFGNAQLDTAQSKYGVSSLYFQGAGSPESYVSLPSAADLALGTGDFTIEFFFRVASLDATFQSIYDQRTVTASVAPTIFISGGDDVMKYFTNNALRITGTTAVVIDTWYHVCVQRYDDVTRLYLNGVQEGSAYADTNNYIQEAILLGLSTNNSGQMDGWIDGVRVTKGTALYGFPDLPDAPFDNTIDDSELLINFDGADAAATYTTDDTVGRTVTFAGDAQLDTAEKRVGVSSLLLNNPTSPSSYVSIPDSTDLEIGANDFTIECYFKTDVTSRQTLIGKYDSQTAGNLKSWFLSINHSGNLQFDWSTNSTTNETAMARAWAPSAGVWYHVAIVRKGTTARMFVDGVQLGASFTMSGTLADTTVPIEVGSVTFGGGRTNIFDGHIDMVRINIGTALYGNDFEPPIDEQGEPII